METARNNVINALSIDVEGFIESNLQSFSIPEKYIDRNKENYEIEKNTSDVLELLTALDIKATFFIVGRIAHDIPTVVREIAQGGHEIGCHSYAHLRVFWVGKDEFREKISSAKHELEDVSGQRVYGFRAPDFSITDESLWALDALKEIGFIYDSSIYPSGLHDVYGIKEATSSIHRLPNGLIEFPLATIKFLGQRFPFGGGGYFRLYPQLVTRYCISRANKHGYPCMFYIHPYEAGSVIPKISELSVYRKFRHYYNCKNGNKRLKKILQATKFGPAIEVLRTANFLPPE